MVGQQLRLYIPIMRVNWQQSRLKLKPIKRFQTLLTLVRNRTGCSKSILYYIKRAINYLKNMATGATSKLSARPD